MPSVETPIKEQIDQLPLGVAEKISDGEAVTTGYKPDRTYELNGKLWIVEIEAGTSRKGFLGGFIKAQKFVEESQLEPGGLLFVVRESSGYTASVSRQVRRYREWMEGHGICIIPVHFFHSELLPSMIDDSIAVLSQDFLRQCAVTLD